MLLAAREPEGMREGERGAGLPRWSACTFGGAPAPRFASFAPGEAKSRRPAPHSAAASSVPMLPSAFGKRAGEADCVICASRRTRLRPSPFGRLRKRPQRGGMARVYFEREKRGQVFPPSRTGLLPRPRPSASWRSHASSGAHESRGLSGRRAKPRRRRGKIPGTRGEEAREGRSTCAARRRVLQHRLKDSPV
jgi:hypothetical protein